MPQEELHRKLTSLQETLQNADKLDDASRELLEQVEQDIKSLLAESGKEPSGETILDRFKEAAHEFEEEHPQLTEAVGRVMDALARFGI